MVWWVALLPWRDDWRPVVVVVALGFGRGAVVGAYLKNSGCVWWCRGEKRCCGVHVMAFSPLLRKHTLRPVSISILGPVSNPSISR
jgi:hypothetical protein